MSKSKSKKTLPDSIKRQMNEWRRGMTIPVPTAYVTFHKSLAYDELRVIQDNGFEIHNQGIKSDGWMDGMRVVWAIVEDRETGSLFKIHWHDGNQEFFVSMPAGGSILFDYVKNQGGPDKGSTTLTHFCRTPLECAKDWRGYCRKDPACNE